MSGGMGHMTEFRVLAILLLGLLAAPPALARTAVIVNSENPVDSVSRKELKRIYKGDITRWDFASESKLLVGLTDYKGKLERAGTFYKQATGLSATRLRTHWFGMAFRGEMYELPRRVKSEAAMITYVADNPNSIGFVDHSSLDPLPAKIKILKIDSRGPNDQGYPFR